MTFIKFNNRILDKKIHQRELILIKNHIKISIGEWLKKYGFEKEKDYYENKKLNLKLKLYFEKIYEEEIV